MSAGLSSLKRPVNGEERSDLTTPPPAPVSEKAASRDFLPAKVVNPYMFHTMCTTEQSLKSQMASTLRLVGQNSSALTPEKITH